MPFLINFLVNLVIGVALSFVGSLIQQATKPKQKTPGVRGTISVGGAEPLSFMLGRWGSAGHLEYAGFWGSDGDTPNANLTHVISFGDLPIRGYRRFFVYGEAVTLAGAAHPTLGYPVLEYRRGGKDHLWVRMHDGSQTTADPLLISAFGAHPDRPWSADMVGRGVPYCVFTARVNRELFSGFPDYFAEGDGIDLGDEDLHDNPIAQIRKLLQGLSFGGVWLWGLQGLSPTRIPDANWDAQVAKANLPIALLGGGSEPQFRAGGEITVDQQPLEVINELLNSCSGRIAEIGGVYKVLVGAPADPVVSFTDEDIIITEGQSYEPFPGLESTFNGVNATYPEPDEKWGMKEAPPLRDLALEAEDDDRRLPATVSFPMVSSGTQVQRLMQAMHLENRRFATHSTTMPPDFWEFEVLDAAAWTSARNGYSGKAFLITVLDDLPNGNQFMGLKENDASDYGWNPATDERPYDVAPLIINRPAPQPMTGWSVAPYVHQDDEGNARRPGIEVGFAAGLVDVRAVRVQIRRDGEVDPFFDGEYPYDPSIVSPSIYIVANPILPNQAYEARGIYLPFSGRETQWSDWLGVVTPNVKLGSADLEIELGEVAAELAQGLNWATAGVRQALAAFREFGTTIAAADLENYNQREVLKRELGVRLGELEASFIEIVEVAIGPGGAFATQISQLRAALGGNEATINVRAEVVAAPVGYSASYAWSAAVDDGEYRVAAFGIDVPAGVDEPTRFWVNANQFAVTNGVDDALPFVFEDGWLKVYNIRLGYAGSSDGVSFIDLGPSPAIHLESSS